MESVLARLHLSILRDDLDLQGHSSQLSLLQLGRFDDNDDTIDVNERYSHYVRNILLLPIQVDVPSVVSDQDLQLPAALVAPYLEIYLLSLHSSLLGSL